MAARTSHYDRVRSGSAASVGSHRDIRGRSALPPIKLDLPPSSGPKLAGKRVGRYIIDRKLGEGGMATVWRAVHEQLGNEVAIKILAPDAVRGEQELERFFREAKVSAIAFALQVTDALAAAHALDIVHRDLKPENLLFRTPEDNADLLIADFGLSRIMDEEAFHVLTTTCGTPGYMAPEIFKKTGHGKPVYVSKSSTRWACSGKYIGLQLT